MIPSTQFHHIVNKITRPWHSLSTQTKGYIFSSMSMIAILIFLLVVVIALGLLTREENKREIQTVENSANYIKQRLQLKLLERDNQIHQLARTSLKSNQFSKERFDASAMRLIANNADFLSIKLFDVNARLITSVSVINDDRKIDKLNTAIREKHGEFMRNFELARSSSQSIFIQPPQKSKRGTQPLRLFLPVFHQQHFMGIIFAQLSLPIIYSHLQLSDIPSRVDVAILDSNGNVLIGVIDKPEKSWLDQLLPWKEETPSASIHAAPIGMGISVETHLSTPEHNSVSRHFLWLIFALSAATLWLLTTNWRFTRLQLTIQEKLQYETNFRRAMEHSMLTGVRVINHDGMITYINNAFSNITGWSDKELVGHSPPYPFWPRDDLLEQQKLLEDELTGRNNTHPVETRIMRRNGMMVDIQRFVSPLIDSSGQQNGWITSIIDVTEANRTKRQLTEAHQRFMRVLSSMDAAIVVAYINSSSILFANKSYRNWFGQTTTIHSQLAIKPHILDEEFSTTSLENDQQPIKIASPNDSTLMETFIPEQSRWLELRRSAFDWVDGRMVYMVIATDITIKRQAEEQAKLHAAQAQSAGRLITMGEMASSVAHELNQPLAAISNYCSGIISRLNNQQISQEDLIVALEKIAKQSHRAGEVIKRIREFVKYSAPNRAPTSIKQIVDESIELASIELHRYKVNLACLPDPDLPMIVVDPILMEQVLINLLRNAAEAIHAANLAPPERIIGLRVYCKSMNDKAGVEFSVEDCGIGLSPEIIPHLFEAFHTTKANGFGIGLNICRSIIESHKGRIHAENLYNQGHISGCRFSFWVPIDDGVQS